MRYAVRAADLARVPPVAGDAKTPVKASWSPWITRSSPPAKG